MVLFAVSREKLVIPSSMARCTAIQEDGVVVRHLLLRELGLRVDLLDCDVALGTGLQLLRLDCKLLVLLGELLDLLHEGGDLLLENRRDVRAFLSKMQKCQANPLLVVTGGIHMHTVRVPDEETLQAIRADLRGLHILVEDGVARG